MAVPYSIDGCAACHCWGCLGAHAPVYDASRALDGIYHTNQPRFACQLTLILTLILTRTLTEVLACARHVAHALLVLVADSAACQSEKFRNSTVKMSLLHSGEAMQSELGAHMDMKAGAQVVPSARSR